MIQRSILRVVFAAIILAITFPMLFNIANCEAFATWQAYSLNVDDKTYPSLWKVSGGKLIEMQTDVERKSIIVRIDSQDAGIGGGTLNIRLSRALINSTNDESFVAYLDGQAAHVNQTHSTSEYRDLQVHFNQGTKEIRIAGTEIVPEFGSLAVTVIVAPIVTTAILVNRFRSRRWRSQRLCLRSHIRNIFLSQNAF